MKILTLKKIPSTNELVETLQQEFSNGYSYKLFGLDSEKSIIVRKSAFVGVQISKSGNEITIQGLLNPSASSSLFSFFDFLWSGGAILGVFFGSSLRKLEKEIAFFLKSKYE